jgi:hypothetical protein
VHTIGIQRESQSADLSARQHGCAVAGVWPDRIPNPCVTCRPGRGTGRNGYGQRPHRDSEYRPGK